jgi:nucleoid-associated protein YgaU
MPEETNKRWDDSLISLGLGTLVVVVSGILLYNYFSQKSPDLVKNQGRPLSTPVASAVAVKPSASPSVKPTAQSSSQAIAQALSSTTPRAPLAATATPTVAVSATPKATAAPSVTAKATSIPSASPVSSVVAQVKATATPAASTSPAVTNQANSTSYTVAAGDSLWSVSEKVYGDGYQWKKIADANNIQGSHTIATGQKLLIPRVEMISATSTTEPARGGATASAQITQSTNTNHSTATVSTPSGTITYTVVRGDYLWKVAQDKCNDPYLWSSIARQNKLDKPSIIHSGNVLTFTCTR